MIDQIGKLAPLKKTYVAGPGGCPRDVPVSGARLVAGAAAERGVRVVDAGVVGVGSRGGFDGLLAVSTAGCACVAVLHLFGGGSDRVRAKGAGNDSAAGRPSWVATNSLGVNGARGEEHRGESRRSDEHG